MNTYWIPVPTAWISPQIVKRLGRAIWLLLLLLSRTTCSSRGLGLVYGGREIRDLQLFSELGVSQNTLGRYRVRLEESGFVFTKTEWHGLKRWFILGTQKYRDRLITERHSRLVRLAWKKIVSAPQADQSRILNPLYNDLVNEITDENPGWIKYGEPSPSSGSVDIISGDTGTKNGVGITDSSKDKLPEKAYEEESEWAFGPHPEPSKRGKINLDIIAAYQLYCRLLGYPPQIPNKEERKLIGAALKRVSCGNLDSAIYDYDYLRNQEEFPIQPLTPAAFFGQAYLEHIQLPEDYQDPDDDFDVPF
ncbi:MAG: hypothetical protein KAU50_12085 [Candidatus Marinimicrobia bacterium]|nr:hypothetical protein [Candidatus Neomarinimicrobiota bacterium]